MYLQTETAAEALTNLPGDGDATDPVHLGWMRGDPVPPEKQIRFGDGSHYAFPQRRWSFSNLQQLLPTIPISRGNAATCPLPVALRDDLDDVMFTPMFTNAALTWAQSLGANYTDGLVVLHRGAIVYERFMGALTPSRQHMAFSVTKSFVGVIAAMLIAENALDADKTAGHYVAALHGAAFADATLRQLLDMTTSLDYTEDFADRRSGVWNLLRATGFLPQLAADIQPINTRDFLCTIQKSSAHGERFAYKTVNTDVLGWVMAEVTGKPIEHHLQDRFWSRLGVASEAFITTDAQGVAFAGGGLNLCLDDMARFGEMMRLGGVFNGQQIVPQAIIDDITHGANPAHFAAAGIKTQPGWSYRNMWWLSHNPHGAYMARGIHGQAIYIDPTAEMVIARFASNHLGSNILIDPLSLPAYEAVAKHLLMKK